ncbi:MAG: NAD-dependent epimerase/dehydratase family protein [Methylacidiphilales bacterium]|nr:NAD-dependent epimerase/dehydratase family protein [Candidatus Methylacidiphilales bacterium]
MKTTVCITGIAGFIGSRLALKLASSGKYLVVGIDSLNDYYDLALKQKRLAEVQAQGIVFHQVNIANLVKVKEVFAKHNPSIVVNLAAEAGVRYSLEQPQAFVDSNLQGFVNIIECARHGKVKHFVYASSSSVYGLNGLLPINESASSDHPTSLYAASKKANESIAHAYAHSLGLPCTGMRFFSVYGPSGRPDMAVWLFTKKILEGTPVQLFNKGNHTRDLIYIDDLVEIISRIIPKPPKPNKAFNPKKPDSSISSAPYRVVNLGTGTATSLKDMVHAIEKALGKKAIIQLLPRQKADSLDTKCNTKLMIALTKYKPKVSAQKGIEQFVKWYLKWQH